MKIRVMWGMSKFAFWSIEPKCSYLTPDPCKYHFGIIILPNALTTRFSLKRGLVLKLQLLRYVQIYLF